MRFIGMLLGVAGLYFVSGCLGLRLAFGNSNATAVWPPSGIAFAALILFGRKTWPAVSLGAFTVNVYVFLHNGAADLPTALWVSAIISAGNTCEALLGHYLVQKFWEGNNCFERLKSSFLFIGTVLVMCLPACTAGPAAVWLAGIIPGHDYPAAWFTWWLGDVAGIFILTPLILVWTRFFSSTITWRFSILDLGFYILVILASGMVFFDWTFPSLLFMPYLVIAIIIWGAFHFELRTMVTAFSISSAIAIWGTIQGHGVFTLPTLNASLISLQVYVLISGISLLPLKAVINERAQANFLLSKAHAELELLLKERSQNLRETTAELKDYRGKIEEILQVVLRTSALDFSQRAPIGDKGDELDAISAGLNTMAEELQWQMKKLRESEERFRLMVDNINDYSIFNLDTNGYIRTWNKGAEKIKGYKADEVIGKHFSIFFTPEEIRDGEPEHNLRMAKEKGHYETQNIRARKDGTRFWADIVYSAIYNAEGKLTGFVKITRDITLRKELEDSLRAQKEMYQTILNTQSDLGEGVAITEGFRFVYVNEALCNIYGYSRSELMNMSFMDLVTPEEKENLLNRRKDRMDGRANMPVYSETSVKHKSGRVVQIGYSMKLMEQDGKQQVFSIIRDITEQKESERKLLESEEKFSKAFQSSPAGITLTDAATGKWIDANDSFLDLIGATREEVIGSSSAELNLMSSEEREKILDEIKKKGKLRDFESKITNKKGERLIVLCSMEELSLGNRTIILTIIYNITARKIAEEKLEQSEKQIATIIEAAPDSVIVIKSNSEVVRWNDEAERTLGWRSEEAVGKYLYDLIIPHRFRDAHKKGLHRFLQTGEGPVLNRRIELPALRRDGTEVQMEFSISPVKMKDEYYFISFLRDITQRKEMEKARARLISIIESSPDFIGFADAKTTAILYINRAGRKMCGIGPDENASNYKIANVHPDWTNKLLRETALPVAVEKGFWYGECAFLNTKNKKEIPVLMSLHAHKSETGEPEIFSTISRDITEKKQKDDEIIELNKDLGLTVDQLQVVNKELESFSYSVSHDLRAPLRAIHGYAKILSEDYSSGLDDDAKHMIKAIMNNSVKMAQLIDELLSFSRLGRKELQKTRVDMKDLAESALREVKEFMPGGKAHVKIQPLLPAEADYSLMNHVFVNLISNAIKFSSGREHPEVEIGSYKKDDENVYFVKDNGVGFDMQYYNKLFGVFQRLHTRDEFEGTGVGLAIVKRIISKHGGKVWADSKPDKGATFYFTLNNLHSTEDLKHNSNGKPGS